MNAIEAMLDGEHYASGFGASWVIGECDSGDLWVPSIVQRVKRGEPWWGARFRAWKPWHWPFYLWTRVKGGVAMIEAR